MNARDAVQYATDILRALDLVERRGKELGSNLDATDTLNAWRQVIERHRDALKCKAWDEEHPE